MITYNRSDRYSWRHQLRRIAWRVNYLLALCAFLLALLVQAQAAQAAPRCPGGYVDGAGRCVYANPAAEQIRRYPSAVPYARCATKLVAGVAVRQCAYPPAPAYRRPQQ